MTSPHPAPSAQSLDVSSNPGLGPHVGRALAEAMRANTWLLALDARDTGMEPEHRAVGAATSHAEASASHGQPGRSAASEEICWRLSMSGRAAGPRPTPPLEISHEGRSAGLAVYNGVGRGGPRRLRPEWQ